MAQITENRSVFNPRSICGETPLMYEIQPDFFLSFTLQSGGVSTSQLVLLWSHVLARYSQTSGNEHETNLFFD